MKLSMVIPCYNEEEALSQTIEKLEPVFSELLRKGLVEEFPRLYLIDDGSRDKTWSVIEGLAQRFPALTGIKLSHNNGHQNALLAGLLEAEGDAVITMDADLQDDIDVLEEMVVHYLEGYEIVYAVRSRRESDTAFKKGSAHLFYGVMKALGIEMVPDHADFRLMGRKALKALEGFEETNLFLRGIVPLLGFRSTRVYYRRAPRIAGKSKYPFLRMLSFAINGITSFSIAPLRLIAALGFLLFLFSLAIGVWVLLVKYVWQDAIPGWTSTMGPLALFGGLQMLSLGVVGEYVGKIYEEVKRRPHYIIEKKTSDL